MLICTCSVCAIGIAYLALFPKYLSSDDKTWYNTNVQIFHQILVNVSVITAGILSIRRFLSALQTGRLGMTLNDREIEMMSGSHSKGRSANGSKIQPSLTSGKFGRGQRSNRDLISQPHLQSNGSALDNSQDLRLRPDKTTRYTTHIVGGGSRGGGDTGIETGERKANAGDVTTKSDDGISDDKSTSSLRKNGVYQQRDFEMHVEYDYHDGESR